MGRHLIPSGIWVYYTRGKEEYQYFSKKQKNLKKMLAFFEKV